MALAEFEALPKSIAVREVHLLIQQPGFRSKAIILVTTLLDAQRYRKASLADLYQLRWQATEVNLQHLKTTLRMEMIVAKTPAMVQKEIWMYMLAYNLLRTLMWQAAQSENVPVLRTSLQGTRQQFNQFRPHLARASNQPRRQLYTTLLAVIPHQLVPLRPHRVEPRVVKRRPKPFPRMCNSLAQFSKLSGLPDTPSVSAIRLPVKMRSSLPTLTQQRAIPDSSGYERRSRCPLAMEKLWFPQWHEQV
jgi:hypothetical protein